MAEDIKWVEGMEVYHQRRGGGYPTPFIKSKITKVHKTGRFMVEGVLTQVRAESNLTGWYKSKEPRLPYTRTAQGGVWVYPVTKETTKEAERLRALILAKRSYRIAYDKLPRNIEGSEHNVKEIVAKIEALVEELANEETD